MSKPEIKKTFSFNPMNGNEFETPEESIKEIKATISEDPEMWFWTLEHQFYCILKDCHNDLDSEVVKKSYRLYQMFNGLMISVLDNTEKES